MKTTRFGLVAALVIGLLFGATGGFLAGRIRQGSGDRGSDLRLTAAGVVAAPGASGATQGAGLPRGPGRGLSAAGAGGVGAIDLSGLAPAEAWRRLIDIADPSARAAAVRRLLDSMPPAEWGGWMAQMVDSFDGGDFDDNDPGSMAILFGTIETFLHHIVSTDPKSCLSAMLALDHRRADDLMPAMISSWARHDFGAARQFFEEHFTDGKNSKADEMARSIVREMAKTDPMGALEWAFGLRDDGSKRRGVTTAFKALLTADRDQAISMVASRSDLPERDNLAAQVARDWAKTDPARALEWARTLPEGVGEGATRTAFDALIKSDYAAARAAFDAAPAGTKSELLPSMAQRAPGEQIGALADMLAGEPASEARSEASKTLMRRWIEEDPTSASRWLAQQPPGEVQDHAILGLVSWADGNEPQSALDWAGTLSDPQLRSRYLGELMERYRASDQEMARTWVSSTTRLTPDERARFLEYTSQKP